MQLFGALTNIHYKGRRRGAEEAGERAKVMKKFIHHNLNKERKERKSDREDGGRSRG